MDRETLEHAMDALLGYCICLGELSYPGDAYKELQMQAKATLDRYQSEGIPLEEYEDVAATLSRLHTSWLMSRQ